MPAITIRNIPDETHRALKARARRHGRSAEAEIREILENAVRSEKPVKVGSELAALGRRFGGVELVVERDRAAADTVSFE
jgi:plasmid stability protein